MVSHYSEKKITASRIITYNHRINCYFFRGEKEKSPRLEKKFQGKRLEKGGRSKSVPMKSTFRQDTDPVRRNCNDSVRELVIFLAKRSKMLSGSR